MSWSICRKPGGTLVGSTASAEGTGTYGRLLPTGRLEAFSDGVFAIAITLLVLELHVPTGQEALLRGLEHEWPRYLGYFVSFAFIGGVWIAHSNLTRFIKAADPDLMRLNLMLLLFVSFLPFTTAIAATHLFASNLSLHEISISTSAERVAAVVFGLKMTLAALMVYLMLRHAARTPGLAADDIAEEELQAFAKERRSAMLLQASATVVGAFLPLTAVIFYLTLSIFFILDPLRHMGVRSPPSRNHGQARRIMARHARVLPPVRAGEGQGPGGLNSWPPWAVRAAGPDGPGKQEPAALHTRIRSSCAAACLTAGG
jgi:TMEM175 potassium channel family protein